ncbi:outer membrane beta-barrel protein [Persicobacter psychrovividus]
MIRPFLFLLSLLFFLPSINWAQGRMAKKGYAYHTSPQSPLKVNLFAGVNAYYGEFGKPFQPKSQNGYANPNLGIGLEYDVSNRAMLRIDASWFKLITKQINNNNSQARASTTGYEAWVGYNRNIFLSLQSGRSRNFFSMYLYIGLGMMAFKPEIANADDGIDGENFLDQQLEVMVPLGGGLRYHFNDTWQLTAEGGVRISGTDLLDGKELKSRLPDLLFPLNIKISYRFKGKGKSKFLYRDYSKFRKKNPYINKGY